MFGALIKLASEALKFLGERQEAKHDLERHARTIECKKRERIAEDVAQGKMHAWAIDQQFIRTAKTKRNILFYAALIPVALCFYPPALEPMRDGFAALESLPQWYRYGLGLMFVSVWGLRGILMQFMQRKDMREIIKQGDAKS